MAAPTEEAMPEPVAQQEEMHPLVGEWNHSLDTPDGAMTGTLAFEMAGDSLVGTIGTDMGGEAWPLMDLTFDAETAKATASFDSGAYGVMELSITVESEDMITGFITVLDYNFDLPLQGSRAVSEE